MTLSRLRIGTRGSRLALVQTRLFLRSLARIAPEVAAQSEIVPLRTAGDRNHTEKLGSNTPVGFFTNEIDGALLAGHVDVAVHAMKDVPVIRPEGFVVPCMLKREEPRDVFVSQKFRKLQHLPKGAILGSASLRREAQIKLIRPDIQFALLRGDVEDRLLSMMERNLAGTVLAYAGLKRLSLDKFINQILDEDSVLPDPGQGAIGVECRADKIGLRQLLETINDRHTHSAVTAERAFLESVGAGVGIAVGGLAAIEGNTLYLKGGLFSADGISSNTDTIIGSKGQARVLGQILGRRLRERLLLREVA